MKMNKIDVKEEILENVRNMKSHLVRGPAVAAAVGSLLGAQSTLGWAGTLKDQIKLL